ncbi:MAG: hypothetical protein LBH16_11265 [Treponema sp.]|jgi:hypothetical protein|nr:hypothetical protein [Treponema sp.]
MNQTKISSVYLKQIAEKYSQDTGSSSRYNAGFFNMDVFLEWPKLELEKRGEGVYPLDYNRIEKCLNIVTEHRDCADFVMPVFLAFLSMYKDSNLLTKENFDTYKSAVINFKYFMNDPNEDRHGICYFTENHQILYGASEYIAGQLFPDELFTNNQQKGSWHRERGKKRLLQWIDWRARFGYSEWLSNDYYGEDLMALSLVWGLAEDKDLKEQAGKLIELTLFDIAINSFNGILGATNGRAYLPMTMRTELPATSAICKLYWDEGSFEAVSIGAVALAVFGYECGEAVRNAALDKSVIINRERMSLDVEDSKKYGLDPARYEDIMFYWGQQTFLHRDVIENSMKICPLWLGMRPSIDAHWEKYQTLEASGFKPRHFDPLLPNGFTEDGLYDPDMACCALTQADIYVYKTPYYCLSNAQDFRKGKAGYQQHIWQATLGGNALVFTNSPGSNEYKDRPSKFIGSKFMPRSVQHQNVLFCVYRLPAESAHFFFTHIYFPQSEFDQVAEEGGWIFASRGGAYIAVFSSVRGKWENPDPDFYKAVYGDYWEEKFNSAKPYEYLVPKHAVVYICEMGDEKTDGSFDNFTAKFRTAAFTGDTFAFSYRSPSLGEMSFGWKGPLRLNGEEISIRDYKRYDNPFCAVSFGEKLYRINAGGKETVLDFNY